MMSATDDELSISGKNYGLAVALCGIFGTVGIHHFYIGNWFHGLIDLALFTLFLVLVLSGITGFGLFVFGIDILHTLFVFYKLIIGEQRDGRGNLITWKRENCTTAD